MRCYSAFFHFAFLVLDFSSDLVRLEEETVNDQETISFVLASQLMVGRIVMTKNQQRSVITCRRVSLGMGSTHEWPRQKKKQKSRSSQKIAPIISRAHVRRKSRIVDGCQPMVYRQNLLFRDYATYPLRNDTRNRLASLSTRDSISPRSSTLKKNQRRRGEKVHHPSIASRIFLRAQKTNGMRHAKEIIQAHTCILSSRYSACVLSCASYNNKSIPIIRIW